MPQSASAHVEIAEPAHGAEVFEADAEETEEAAEAANAAVATSEVAPSCELTADAQVAEPLIAEPASEGPLPSLTDQQLLAGLRAGSESHFGELYNRYFQRIYSFTYSRIRNHADAEEVVQETFTAVFRSFESYRGTSSLLSWIYGIAKNTLNNNLRRAKTEGARLDNLTPEILRPPSVLSDCNPEEILNMRRYTEAIRDRLESVSPWQTEIFAMRHLQNMSIQEISDRTHRSSDAIRSSLYRVKRLLFETADLGQASAARSSPPTSRSDQQVDRG